MDVAHYHKNLVNLLRQKTGCTHEVACSILGEVCEVMQKVHTSAYIRGYNVGYNFASNKLKERDEQE